MVSLRLLLRTSLITGLLGLTGCSSDDFSLSGNECVDHLGPIPPVGKTLESFRVGDGKSVDGSLREFTLMRVFFQAIMPDPEDANSDRAETLAREAGELSQPFIHFAGGFPGYQSSRNMPDLMEALIVSGTISTFNDARLAMRRCVEEDQFGRYRNRQIQLQEQPQDEESEPETWRIQLEYDHNPSPVGGRPNIRRFIHFHDFNVTFLSLYDRNAFSANGFNTPRLVSLSFNQEVNASSEEDTSKPQLSFFSNRPDEQQPEDQELWVWSLREGHHSMTGPDGEEQAIACMILRADYRTREVEVWTQQNPCSAFDDAEGLNPLENFRYAMNPDVATKR